MPLVEDLIRVAAMSGGSFEHLSGGGRDRFGPVEVLMLAHGLVSVRRGCDNDYEVTVWADDEIIAEGRTAVLADLAGTLLDWQEGRSVQELCRRHRYLEATDVEGGIEALWHVLIEHGDDYLRPQAAAISSNPTLRGLRPWVGHGTLHLLHHRDRIGSIRYGLAFYRAGDDMFRLDVYGGGPFGPPEPLASAMERAAAAAGSW
jgi:hypothetical protein